MVLLKNLHKTLKFYITFTSLIWLLQFFDVVVGYKIVRKTNSTQLFRENLEQSEKLTDFDLDFNDLSYICV